MRLLFERISFVFLHNVSSFLYFGVVSPLGRAGLLTDLASTAGVVWYDMLWYARKVGGHI